jgi:hypothetical protein
MTWRARTWNYRATGIERLTESVVQSVEESGDVCESGR